MPNDGGKGTGDFVKPDLKVLEVDLEGLMFTMALGVQQMRRQEVREGFRGKSEFSYFRLLEAGLGHCHGLVEVLICALSCYGCFGVWVLLRA